MATNPDQVRGPTPEQLEADRAASRARADAAAARKQQFENAIYSALGSRDTNVNQLKAILAQFNQTLRTGSGTPEAVDRQLQAVINWTKDNPDADVRQVPIETMGGFGEEELPGEATIDLSILPQEQQDVLSALEDRERIAVRPEGQAVAETFRRYYRDEPVGLDPASEQWLREKGWGYLIPLASPARALLELGEAGLESGFAGIGQNLANLVNPLTGERTINPNEFTRQAMGLTEGATLNMPVQAMGMPNASLAYRGMPTTDRAMASVLSGSRPFGADVLNPNQRAAMSILARQSDQPVTLRNLYAPTEAAVASNISRTLTPEAQAMRSAMESIGEPTAAPPTAPARAAAAAPDIPTEGVSGQATASQLPPVGQPAQRAAQGEIPFPQTAQGRREAMDVLTDMGETQPIISHDLNQRMSRFAADYLNAAELTRPKDIPFTEFFRQHLGADSLPVEATQALLKKHGLNELDIVEATTGFRVSANEWGRIGQALSVASRLVPTEMGDLAKLTRGAAQPSLWRRLGNTQRGMLVSQTATTMRNNLSSLGRLGIDSVVGFMDSVVNAALNPVRRSRGMEEVVVDPLEAFRLLVSTFKPGSNRQLYRQLANTKPRINRELAATYNADVYRNAFNDKFSRVEKAVDVFNMFNRVSERFTRQAVFAPFLRRAYNRAGNQVTIQGRKMSFDELVNGNQLHLIDKKVFERALNDTLEFTYSASPKKGSWAADVISALDKMGPVGATLVPFPRFMMNAIKFQHQYSPTAFLEIMFSPKQWRAIMDGDTTLLNKGLVGTGLLYAAYQFQNSDYAGSKWYMARTSEGTEVDLRPYFPAPYYLFLADVIKRSLDGTIDQAYTGKDIVQGLTGAQFRAGASLYAIDDALEDIAGSGSRTIPERASQVVSQIVANTGAAWLTKLGEAKDIMAQFDEEEATRRDTREDPLATLLRSVPGAQQMMGAPEQTYASRGEPVTTQNPLLRQALGATVTTTNPLELELRELGLDSYDLYKNLGIPDLDRKARGLVGSTGAYYAPQLLNSPEYQAADTLDRTDMIQELFKEIRAAVREDIKDSNPAYAELMRINNLDREDKIRLNREYQRVHGESAESYLRELAKQIEEAPIVNTQQQFDALPSGTNYTDPGDLKVYTKK